MQGTCPYQICHPEHSYLVPKGYQVHTKITFSSSQHSTFLYKNCRQGFIRTQDMHSSKDLHQMHSGILCPHRVCDTVTYSDCGIYHHRRSITVCPHHIHLLCRNSMRISSRTQVELHSSMFLCLPRMIFLLATLTSRAGTAGDCPPAQKSSFIATSSCFCCLGLFTLVAGEGRLTATPKTAHRAPPDTLALVAA